MGNKTGKQRNVGKTKDVANSKPYVTSVPSKNNTIDRKNTDVQIQRIIQKGKVEQYYDVNTKHILGRGHYASVCLAVKKATGERVALKRIRIQKSHVKSLKREIEVLRKVGSHPNIVTMYDVFITETEVQLVLELLEGGELFERMVDKGPYSELQASHHICKIGEALKFLHDHGIVHRDLKPENLILTHKGDDAELKIADFGLSKIVDNVATSRMQTVCGTWAYCAPEVKRTGGNTSYTAKVDLWSTGVILFVILAAYHPFDPDGNAPDSVLWANIVSGVFTFDDPAWVGISDSVKDLIRNLIVLDPVRRYGTKELLQHPWVARTHTIPSTPITPSINRSLEEYAIKRSKSRNVVKMNRVGSNNICVPIEDDDS